MFEELELNLLVATIPITEEIVVLANTEIATDFDKCLIILKKKNLEEGA